MTYVSYAQQVFLEPYASGFSSPVNIKHAGDDRLFVAERGGIIKIINADGTVNTTPFLDIDARVTDAGGERGLLALAFHPDYITNGFFYVNYINNSGDTVIARFSRSTINTADQNSEVILFTISQPFSNHNGGDLHFGPNDGFLYISTGDGGSAGDPGNRAQNQNLLLGKMLRIDVNVTQAQIDAGTTYLIPADNPFVSDATVLDEIWANGLRNPFKFSFDRLNGDLWIADVGQGIKEEISKVAANSTGGENYGWKCFEGTSIFSNATECGMITHTTPIAEYEHGAPNFRCSITGGYRYRGTLQTGLVGLYFFADFCSDEISYVTETSANNFSLTFMDDYSPGSFSAFGEDVNGELFVCSLSNGSVLRVSDALLNVENQTLKAVKLFPNPAKISLTIDLSNAVYPINSINIHDITGKVVLNASVVNKQTVTISTETLTSGLYLVEISDTSGNKTTKKLIIE